MGTAKKFNIQDLNIPLEFGRGIFRKLGFFDRGSIQ